MKKIYLILQTLSIILLLFWVLYLFIIPQFKRKEIVLLDLSSLTLSDSIIYLNDNNLKYNLIKQEESSTTKILYTNPKANSIVKENSIIDIYISSSSENILDDYVNTLYFDSKDKINDYCAINKIKININYEENKNLPDGLIIKQEENKVIGVLNLTIIKNEDTFIMNNYVGMHINDIEKDLNKYNLNIVYDFCESFLDFGICLSQSVKNGYIVNKDNKNQITFIISKGI